MNNVFAIMIQENVFIVYVNAYEPSNKSRE